MKKCKKIEKNGVSNMKESLKLTTLGFTLVELLAVIVILAIILVIAVPKVMNLIEDTKKAALETTAKMIANQAEKTKMKNTLLGKTDEITCESVAKINDIDYASCDIQFENNTAKVTIEGSRKFEGLWICNGTKVNAVAQKEKCELLKDENNNESGSEADPDASPIYLAPNSTWYKGTTGRNTITEIELVDMYYPTGNETESWAADENSTGAYSCYVLGTKLYISGNGSGKIRANADSSYLFADINQTTYFWYVTDIKGLEFNPLNA